MGRTLKMTVSIEFLGMQRAIAKSDRIDMPITRRTRVIDALEHVRREYPGLHLDERTVLITVNQEMAALDTLLKANDTVLFLPSISGG